MRRIRISRPAAEKRQSGGWEHHDFGENPLNYCDPWRQVDQQRQQQHDTYGLLRDDGDDNAGSMSVMPREDEEQYVVCCPGLSKTLKSVKTQMVSEASRPCEGTIEHDREANSNN